MATEKMKLLDLLASNLKLADRAKSARTHVLERESIYIFVRKIGVYAKEAPSLQGPSRVNQGRPIFAGPSETRKAHMNCFVSNAYMYAIYIQIYT